MNIAFIGFGKVSHTLCELIDSPNINLATSTENRSKNTIELIEKSNVCVYDSFSEAIENADIVISANSPSKAIDVSKTYAGNFKGIYLDLNNISPKTACEIDDAVYDFVDGAIIGKIDLEEYLNNDEAQQLSILIRKLKDYEVPPLVALTANTFKGSKDMYLSEGFDEYLPKPIDLIELDALVNKYFKK